MGEWDNNLFMVCRGVDPSAKAPLPPGFHIRTCRPDELGIWMDMPFDTPEDAARYRPFMEDYFARVYSGQRDAFFKKCLFVCDREDQPLGTCFIWKAYDRINTLHWLKVLKPYESQGLGRALLWQVLSALKAEDYPVCLHTQPGSFRAIKLYSDFGFDLIEDPMVGARQNQLKESLPLLQKMMPQKAFESLRFTFAPQELLDAAASSPFEQF